METIVIEVGMWITLIGFAIFAAGSLCEEFS